MPTDLLAYYVPVRLGAFVALLAIIGTAETLAARRRPTAPRAPRWVNHLAVIAIGTAAVRLVFPLAALELSVLAAARGWGLLHVLAAPAWLALPLSLLALDFAIYLQHVMFHAVPVLWRLHRMHHTDVNFDVTTGIRFHPFEIVISMGVKLAVVAALGPPPLAVLLFEVLLMGTSLFNHGNLRLPLALDAALRWLVVTPDMHRVHHSVLPQETNSNFGFNAPWWDRLCGTYRAQPQDGHERMSIGLNQFRDPREIYVHRMLLQPFREPARDVPIGER